MREIQDLLPSYNMKYVHISGEKLAMLLLWFLFAFMLCQTIVLFDRKRKQFESKRQPKHETDHFCVRAMQDIIFILPEGIFKRCFT